jgi:succinoglycan biosynthesis protein ExoV
MELYYYESRGGNFGDHLNTWLWEALYPGRWDQDGPTRLAAIGTLLDGRMPAGKPWAVFGSGTGYSPPPPGILGQADWERMCVRGPLTASALGLPEHAAASDGALLLRLLPEAQPVPESERDGIVFMPHHYAQLTGRWRDACERAGIDFICPRTDSRETVQRLRRARLVIADAMHAAIVADALRVPWVPVVSSPEINGFKWMDWTASLDLDYRPLRLAPSTPAEEIRGAMLRFQGQNHALSAASDAEALAHLARQQRWKRWPWKAVKKASRLLSRHLLEPAARLRSGQNPRRADAWLDDAAQSLRQAAADGGWLSDDAVLAARLDDMTGRLRTLMSADPASGAAPQHFHRQC